MKIFRMSKRLLAMLLTLALLTGALPVSALAESTAEGVSADQQADAQGTVNASLTDALTDALPFTPDETVVYHEVTFALPAGTTEEEAGVTVLPEPQMVKDGTQIGVLEENNLRFRVRIARMQDRIVDLEEENRQLKEQLGLACE